MNKSEYKYALHLNIYVLVNVSVYTAFREVHVHCSVNKKCHIYQSGTVNVYDYLMLLN